MNRFIYLLAAIITMGGMLSAQTISYSTAGSTYTQDFNTLPATGTFAYTGLGVRDLSATPVNASGMTGWYFAKNTGSGSTDLFAVEAGAGSSGGLKDYGSAGSTDRALGGLGSGTYAPKFGALITNNTGVTLNKFTITFTGEQWRVGSTNVNTLTFKYKINAASINDASGFVAVPALNFASPVGAGTAAALDGNAPANRTAGITATVSGLTWAPGSVLAIQWAKIDESGADDGIAIDDLTFSADIQPPVNFYYFGTGDLNDVANWGMNADGTGTAPANFTTDVQIFTICNTSSVSTTTPWTVSGAGSKIVVGNGTNATTLTISSGAPITGALDAAANAVVTLQDAAIPSFASLAGTSTIDYAQSGTVAVSNAASYGNLKLTNGTKTIPSGNTTVAGNMIVDNVTGFTGSGTLVLAGDLTLENGTTMATGMSLTCNGSSAQTITGNGTDISVFKLTHGNSAGIILSTIGGTSNLVITGASGGNLALGANKITTGTNYVSVAPGASSNVGGGYVIGKLKKNFTSAVSSNFEVGTANGYSPVLVNATAGTGNFTVSATQAAHPNANSTNVLSRYWTTTSEGVTQADLTFTYLASDVTGSEAAYVVGAWNGSNWVNPSATYDNTLHTATVAGATSFAQWTLGVVDMLPVELVSFTATAKGGTVVLNWKTATEVNNCGFDIEKNINGSWTKLAFVAGNGTTNKEHNYSYVDAKAAGSVSYRLKQIDNDGAFKYSQVAAVEAAAPKGFELCNAYPNPFNPATQLRFAVPENGVATLIVYNALGQQVATLYNGMAQAGQYITATFNAGQFASGVYVARLQFNGKSMMQKMMLAK